MTSILRYFAKTIKSRTGFIIAFFHISTFLLLGTTAKFAYTKRSECSPTTVIFKNISTSATSYIWNFGTGAIVVTKDKTDKEISYTNPGQYKITLIATDGTNTDSISEIINIYKSPVASFTANPRDGCAPLLTKLTNTSEIGDAAIVNVNWDFRNGTSSSGNTINHSYDSIGKYDILMKVTDNNGCYDFVEMKDLINVVKKPVANFSGSETFACTAPLNVAFFNLSTGANNLTYKWNFGNGLTSKDINSSSLYRSNGSFNVKLVVTDSFLCADSLTKNSYIRIGNRNGDIILKDNSGTVLHNSLLCPGSYTFKFNLGNQSDIEWTINYQNKTQIFSNTDSINILAQDSGYLNIKVFFGRKSACPDSIMRTYIIDFLKSDFTINNSSVCNLLSIIKLQNASQNESSLTWIFPDGTTNNNPQTTYTISKNLTYKQIYNHSPNHFDLPFKLVAINTFSGCKDTMIKTVSVQLPVARLMPDRISGCAPLDVTFSDSSRSDLPITKRNYVFKTYSGTYTIVKTDRNPVQYTFSFPGIYAVFETIETGQGCKDTSENVIIRVGDANLVNDFSISPTTICNGDKIRITATSNLSDSIKLWQISSKSIFNMTFINKPDTTIAIYTDSVGKKDITLETDYNGCISAIKKSNVLNIKGLAGNIIESFSCDSPLLYKFKSKINPSTSRNWIIGTDTFKNVDSIKYYFPPGHGNYNVKLNAIDNASGCSLVKNKLIKVRQVKAGFLADSVICVGDTFKVDASKSIDYINTCYNEGFLWDFGDKTPRQRTFLPKFFHFYQHKGKYYPLLVVRADNDCQDTIKDTLRIVQPLATLQASPDSGCAPNLNVSFNYTDSSVVWRVLDYGDNSIPSVNFLLPHNYNSDYTKTFFPQLRVKDKFGCTLSIRDTVLIKLVDPTFQAFDNSICVGQQVTFIPSEKNLSSFTWDFGDGQKSSSTNIHVYNKIGKYDVTFSASKYGCTTKNNKLLQYISVEKADANYLLSDSILKCYPDTITFKHPNTNGSVVYTGLWRFGDKTNTAAYSNEVQYVYVKPGTYKTSLFVNTLNNCQASTSKTIVIKGPIAKFEFSPKKICYGESVSFKLDSLTDAAGFNWNWVFGDGNTSSVNPVTHKYNFHGMVFPQILMSNSDCTVANGTDTLIISKLEANFDLVGNGAIICFGNPLETQNISHYFSSSTWELNNNIISTKTNLTGISLTELGNYDVKLIVKDNGNCVDSIVKKVTLAPLPTFKITGDSSICKENDSTILNVSHNDNWKILWQPATGLSSPTSFSPTVKPANTTTYLITVTTENNCEAVADKTIIVKQPFDIKRFPIGDTSIFIGQKIKLSILSDPGVQYDWTPNYRISCRSCSDPFVSPEKQGINTYSVKVKDKCYTTSQTFNINVIIDYYLEAPNAFTPNGDNKNDIFKFEMKDIKIYELKIYNRWGDLVYWTENPENGWDGKIKGKLQNIDTYMYYIKAETTYGYKFEKKGSLLLLK